MNFTKRILAILFPGAFLGIAVLMICAVVVLLASAFPAFAQDAETNADVAAFEAYLKAQGLDARWQSAPLRLKTDEIRKSYPVHHVYYAFKAPPRGYVGGAAPSREILKREAEEAAAHQKVSLRLVTLIKDGVVTPLKNPADYNTGLMPVKSDADAQIAAAAILSMQFVDGTNPPYGPTPVAAKDIKATRVEAGWRCTTPLKYPMVAIGPRDGWQGEGTVMFDAAGRVTAVSMRVDPVGPFIAPPRAPANR